jgi:hypothetical protein
MDVFFVGTCVRAGLWLCRPAFVPSAIMNTSVADEMRALDGEISSIEQQIASLQADARALRTRRNLLTTLGRLPVDVLGRLLDMIVCESRLAWEAACEDLTPDDGLRAPNDWMRFVGTCRRVRDVALASPLIWTHVDLDNSSRWIALCKERAALCPLSVWYHGFPKNDVELWEDLLPCAAELRIHDLHIHPHLHSYMQTAMTRPHPLLSIFEYFVGRPYALTETFIAGAGASLTQLILTSVYVPAHSIEVHFPRLSYLELSHVGLHRPEDLLQLLRQCAELEDLRLHNVGAHNVDLSSHQTPIAFPKLRVAVIKTHLAWLHRLIPSLPASIHDCTLSAMRPDSRRDDPEDALRAQVFDMAARLLGRTSAALDLHLEPDHLRGVLNPSWRLRFERTDPPFVYEDLCGERDLRSYDLILSRARTLYVHAEADVIFEHATLSDVDPLAAIEHIVVKGYGDVEYLQMWLQRRFNAGTRVGTVELLECNQWIDNYEELACQVRDNGWAGAIVVERD